MFKIWFDTFLLILFCWFHTRAQLFIYFEIKNIDDNVEKNKFSTESGYGKIWEDESQRYGATNFVLCCHIFGNKEISLSNRDALTHN